MPDPADTGFPEPGGMAPEDPALPWNDRTRIYRAVHTRQGRILLLCFIAHAGSYKRYLPLSDLRYADANEDGTELVLEFSSFTVEVTGQRLERTADNIAIGRVAALEAFNPERRDAPDDPQAPYIASIRFFKPKPPEPPDRKSKAKPAAAKPPAPALAAQFE